MIVTTMEKSHLITYLISNVDIKARRKNSNLSNPDKSLKSYKLVFKWPNTYQWFSPKIPVPVSVKNKNNKIKILFLSCEFSLWKDAIFMSNTPLYTFLCLVIWYL